MVTGGSSSGKSDFAEKKVSELGEKVVYIATNSIDYEDIEMKKKVKNHREKRRGKGWRTIECYKNIANQLLDLQFDSSILDCVTMLIANNIFESTEKFDPKSEKDVEAVEKKIFDEIESILDYIKDNDKSIVFVSNENSMGVVPIGDINRYFLDLHGRINQKIASMSDEVYFVISGIPVRIK